MVSCSLQIDKNWLHKNTSFRDLFLYLRVKVNEMFITIFLYIAVNVHVICYDHVLYDADQLGGFYLFSLSEFERQN